MNKGKVPFEKITDILNSLCETKEDEQNLHYLSQWIQSVHEDEGFIIVVLNCRRKHVLTISSDTQEYVEFFFDVTLEPIEKILDEEYSYFEPDISSIGAWGDPYDWLNQITQEDTERFSDIQFMLSVTNGCYFSINNQQVFLDRDHPEIGLSKLSKGEAITKDYEHPFADFEFEGKNTNSLFLTLVRYFIEKKDYPVVYKVSIFSTKHRLNTISELASMLDIKIKEAKKMVEGLTPVAKNLDSESALKLKKKLESIGVKVSISEEIEDS
ncbi:hypothetical protein BKI52_30180 [marine bacterium AO1-C]|nr:hypothetical protein BKI52_30180 [marine bacterium AO1-C]